MSSISLPKKLKINNNLLVTFLKNNKHENKKNKPFISLLYKSTKNMIVADYVEKSTKEKHKTYMTI